MERKDFISISEPYCVDKELKLRFLLEVNGELIEVPQSLMVFLASNTDSSLNHFLAGFFKAYPKEESDVCYYR